MNKRDKRLISMFIDYSLLAIAIVAGVFIIGIHVVQKNYYLFLFIAAIICSFKDVFGQSVGHRLLQLKLIDRSTEKAPAIWKRFVRNLTLFIWPVEVAAVFLRKDNRRLSDVLLNTDVITLE